MKKTNFMKSALLVAAFALISTSSFGLANKPFRIGVKAGFPNLFGYGVEFLTPVLGSKLSAAVDYSPFKIKLESGGSSLEFKYSYFSIGGNYYFFREGKGLYGGLHYSRLGFKVSASQTDPLLGTGSAEAKTGFNLYQIKIGAKLGGLFYFRPELGWGLGTAPKSIDMEYNYNGTTQKESEDISGIPVGSGFVANIGIGFAFP